jgi:hypothetical protein
VCETDADGDGYLSEGEQCGLDCCDSGDEDSLGCTPETADGINPDAQEICEDGIDQNCDGIDDECPGCDTDADGDGYTSQDCGGADCCDTGSDTSLGCTDETAGGINPGADEICGDGVDSDCDGKELICAGGSYVIGGQSLAQETTYASAGYRTGGASAYAGPVTANALAGDEAVFLIAVLGDDQAVASSNSGVKTMESCQVDQTGHLACADTDDTWVTQTLTSNQDSFGHDALLYFSLMYSFFGLADETVGADLPSTQNLRQSTGSRYAIAAPDDVAAAGDGQIVGSRQSNSTGFNIKRAYHKMERLLAYVYVVGGMSEAGPTSTVERHQQ